MIKKVAIALVLGLFLCCFQVNTDNAHSDSPNLYDQYGCIYMNDKNIVFNNEDFTLYPIDRRLMSYCSLTCTQSFGINDNSLGELNADVIDKCIASCQGGDDSFSDYKRTVVRLPLDNSDYNLPMAQYDYGPTSVSFQERNNWSDDNENKDETGGLYYISDFQVRAGDSILVNADGIENRISMCGTDELTISPIFPNLALWTPELLYYDELKASDSSYYKEHDNGNTYDMKYVKALQNDPNMRYDYFNAVWDGDKLDLGESYNSKFIDELYCLTKKSLNQGAITQCNPNKDDPTPLIPYWFLGNELDGHDTNWSKHTTKLKEWIEREFNPRLVHPCLASIDDGYCEKNVRTSCTSDINNESNTLVTKTNANYKFATMHLSNIDYCNTRLCCNYGLRDPISDTKYKEGYKLPGCIPKWNKIRREDSYLPTGISVAPRDELMIEFKGLGISSFSDLDLDCNSGNNTNNDDEEKETYEHPDYLAQSRIRRAGNSADNTKKYYDYNGALLDYYSNNLERDPEQYLKDISTLNIKIGSEIALVGEAPRKLPLCTSDDKVKFEWSNITDGNDIETKDFKFSSYILSTDNILSDEGKQEVREQLNNMNQNDIQKLDADVEGQGGSYNLLIPCKYIQRPGSASYRFVHKPNTETDKEQKQKPLSIRRILHSKGSKYTMLGNYQVNIKRVGCPFYNGDGLHYAMLNDEQYDEFTNIPSLKGRIEKLAGMSNEQNSEQISGQQRIKIPDNVTQPSRVIFFLNQEYLTQNVASEGHYAVSGSYDIRLTSRAEKGFHVSHLNSLVQLVDEILFGKSHIDSRTKGTKYCSAINDDCGIVGNIFKYVTLNNKYVAFITLLLVISVLLIAFNYIIGATQFNQYEALKQLIAWAIIATLISPLSWKFISTQLLVGIVDGSLELMNVITQSGLYLKYSDAHSQHNDFTIFQSFDYMLTEIFTPMNGWRMLALALGSFFGFVLIIMLIITIIVYILTIVRATVFYVFCLIGLALLFIISPICIPMCMFKQTEEIFRKWVQDVISYMLQPIFIAISVAMFNILIIIAYKIALSVNICIGCWLKIPFLNICLIRTYLPLYSMHYPDTAGTAFIMPMGILAGYTMFIILTYGMWDFCKITTQMLQKMIIFREGEPSQVSIAGGAADRATTDMEKIVGGTDIANPNLTMDQASGKTLFSRGMIKEPMKQTKKQGKKLWKKIKGEDKKPEKNVGNNATEDNKQTDTAGQGNTTRNEVLEGSNPTSPENTEQAHPERDDQVANNQIPQENELNNSVVQGEQDVQQSQGVQEGQEDRQQSQGVQQNENQPRGGLGEQDRQQNQDAQQSGNQSQQKKKDSNTTKTKTANKGQQQEVQQQEERQGVVESRRESNNPTDNEKSSNEEKQQPGKKAAVTKEKKNEENKAQSKIKEKESLDNLDITKSKKESDADDNNDNDDQEGSHSNDGNTTNREIKDD